MDKSNIIMNAISGVLFLFLAFVIYKSFQVNSEKREILEVLGDTTYCKITSLQGNYLRYKFNVNNTKYAGKVENLGGQIQIGEAFKIVYNRENPNKQREVLFAYPIISNEIDFEETVSLNLSRNWNIHWDVVYFKYDIDGILHKRFQLIPKILNFNDDSTYLIKYHVDNPKIAYIFFYP